MSETRRPDEFYIQALRRLVRRVDMKQPSYVPGLTGVVAGETAVSKSDEGRCYRGYPLRELVGNSSFLEVAYLLLYGELPGHEEFADFSSLLVDCDDIDRSVEQILQDLPLHVSAASMLRTTVSALGNVDPLADDLSADACLAKATRLIAQIPSVIAASQRHRTARHVPDAHPALTYTANLLFRLLEIEPDELSERALDAALIVNAEQGFDTSTFAARVVASAGSEFYAALTAAVGTLNTDCDTAPSSTIYAMLETLEQTDSIDACCQQWLMRYHRIPGFDSVPRPGAELRIKVLNEYCQQLAARSQDDSLERRVSELENCLESRLQLQPHLGWTTTRLFRYLGFAPELGRPLYLLSRLPGWSAHIKEQTASHCPIHPEANYIGPSERRFTELSRRY